MDKRIYIAIDLKSFYASVECADRGLDPLDTNLVVADPSRTEKTICLAVSPSLKTYGIGGRARLFEVVEKIKEVNLGRSRNAPQRILHGTSYYAQELQADPALAVAYLIAPPRMARYMEVSAQIYQIYLRYIAPEDIYAYSVDEVFIDATAYLKSYRMTARELTCKMILDVLQETGITATAGIGTNLYLAKIAMDIVAKRMPADRNGVRIAELDEISYRQTLWHHRPLTDFWRIGNGYARKLTSKGIYTMGDIARCSLGKKQEFYNAQLLYKMFGVNAELLIDHAWGRETCTLADIKAYQPQNKSLSSGQVLQQPYSFEKGRLIIHEMTELLVLDMVEKGVMTDQLVLTIGYDIENLTDPERRKNYHGAVTTDHYGRKVPKAAHGSINLLAPTSSTRQIVEAALQLYDQIANRELTIRRMYVVANHIVSETVPEGEEMQLDLFTDYEELMKERMQEEAFLKREKSIQKTLLQIRNKFGKNAVLKGMNYEEGATTIERNSQVGGHRA